MFDAYIQIDGIKGESQEDQHKDWIEVLSYNHRVSLPTSSTRSSSGGGTTGASEHGDIYITKFVDMASPKLHDAVSTGKHFKKAAIDFCRQGGGSKVKYLTINLEEVVISSVVSDGHGKGEAELPVETVGLNYANIEWIYTQQKRPDGSGSGNVTAKYDLRKAKGS
jgi:type VI secretion system secreted protein Hcp